MKPVWNRTNWLGLALCAITLFGALLYRISLPAPEEKNAAGAGDPEPAQVGVPAPGNVPADGAERSASVSSVFLRLVDRESAYWQRFRALQELPWGELEEPEIRFLVDYLECASAGVSDPLGEFSLRNDVLRGLIDLRADPEILLGVLLAVPQEKDAHHVLWREYVLQHYSIFLQDYQTDGLLGEDPQRSLVGELERHLNETQTGIAGTALLNMHRLRGIDGSRYGGLPVEPAAIALATDPDAAPASRIAAAALLPDRYFESAFGEALDLLSSGEANMVFKAALLRRALEASASIPLPGGRVRLREAVAAQDSRILKNILGDDTDNEI